MMNSGGMEVQGSDEGMIGPGSSSIFTDGSRSYLVYHYYDAFHNGDPWVQVRPLIWAAGRLAGDGPAADPGSRQPCPAGLIAVWPPAGPGRGARWLAGARTSACRCGSRRRTCWRSRTSPSGWR